MTKKTIWKKFYTKIKKEQLFKNHYRKIIEKLV